MPIDLSALRTELLSSAQASTYSASIAIGDDNTTAAVVNTVGSGTLTVSFITAAQLQQAVTASEYVALTAVQRDLWDAVLTAAVAGVSISNAAIRLQVAHVWSAGTTTRGTLSSRRRDLIDR